MAFRDRKGWINDGFEFSVAVTDEAFQLLDEAIFKLYGGRSAKEILDELKNMAPDFIMGKVMRYIQLGDTSVIQELKHVLEAGSCTEVESLHCKALMRYDNHDNEGAGEIWSEILLAYPKDLVALMMTYNVYFTLGKSNMLRNLPARTLPHFEKTSPYYGYILNRLAFGLEETNFFELANKTVKEGLGLVPDDYWGIHTQAHIYESLCKFQDGIDFLERTENLWENQCLSCHTYWHLCLFYVELGNYSKALEIFDEKMKAKIFKEKSFLGTMDGVQLLYRLEFNDFNVGERWEDIYKGSHLLKLEHCNALYVLHLYLSYLRSTTSQSNGKPMEFMKKLETHIQEAPTYNSTIVKSLVIPMIHAFNDHYDKKYGSSVMIMYSLKERIIELGGSNSQRDFFNLFLFDSCLRSTNKRILGRQLLYERLCLKSDSPMTKTILEKM